MGDFGSATETARIIDLFALQTAKTFLTAATFEFCNKFLKQRTSSGSLGMSAKCPNTEVVNQRGGLQLSCPSRASISSRSKVKSMGLVSNPVAPPSIAFRLVSGSP